MQNIIYGPVVLNTLDKQQMYSKSKTCALKVWFVEYLGEINALRDNGIDCQRRSPAQSYYSSRYQKIFWKLNGLFNMLCFPIFLYNRQNRLTLGNWFLSKGIPQISRVQSTLWSSIYWNFKSQVPTLNYPKLLLPFTCKCKQCSYYSINFYKCSSNVDEYIPELPSGVQLPYSKLHHIFMIEI